MAFFSIDIQKFDAQTEPIDYALVCVEKGNVLQETIGYSLVTVEGCVNGNRYTLKIRFDWTRDIGITKADFLYIPESATLFFRSENQWGAVDLHTQALIRHEQAFGYPYIEKRDSYVLITGDLEAEATRLNGERIDVVPIDPPTERTILENRIEYLSPLFGKQILKLK